MSFPILFLPVRTQRRFNVHTTSSQRHGRCIDVEKRCVVVLLLYVKVTFSRRNIFENTAEIKISNGNNYIAVSQMLLICSTIRKQFEHTLENRIPDKKVPEYIETYRFL